MATSITARVTGVSLLPIKRFTMLALNMVYQAVDYVVRFRKNTLTIVLLLFQEMFQIIARCSLLGLKVFDLPSADTSSTYAGKNSIFDRVLIKF